MWEFCQQNNDSLFVANTHLWCQISRRYGSHARKCPIVGHELFLTIFNTTLLLCIVYAKNHAKCFIAFLLGWLYKTQRRRRHDFLYPRLAYKIVQHSTFNAATWHEMTSCRWNPFFNKCRRIRQVSSMCFVSSDGVKCYVVNTTYYFPRLWYHDESFCAHTSPFIAKSPLFFFLSAFHCVGHLTIYGISPLSQYFPYLNILSITFLFYWKKQCG